MAIGCSDYFCPPINYHGQWKYARDDECGDALSEWAENNNLYLVFDAKDLGTFRYSWQRDYNSDLCFVSRDGGDHPIRASREALPIFTHSQHRPVILDIGLSVLIVRSVPRPRWNFRRADWQGFADHLDKYICFILPEPKGYQPFMGAVLAAAKKFVPRGYRS